MCIAERDFCDKDKNFLNIKHGDLLCKVMKKDGWSLVFFDSEPNKLGFVPDCYLNSIIANKKKF